MLNYKRNIRKVETIDDEILENFKYKDILKNELKDIKNWEIHLPYLIKDMNTVGIVHQNVKRYGDIYTSPIDINHGSLVYGDCYFRNNVMIKGSKVFGKVLLKYNVNIYRNCDLNGNIRITHNVGLSSSVIHGNVRIKNCVFVNNCIIDGNVYISGPLYLNNMKIHGNVKINQGILKNLGCYMEEDMRNLPNKGPYVFNLVNSMYLLEDYEIYNEKTLKHACFLSSVKNLNK